MKRFLMVLTSMFAGVIVASSFAGCNSEAKPLFNVKEHNKNDSWFGSGEKKKGFDVLKEAYDEAVRGS